METFSISLPAARPMAGERNAVIVGVVASGNLEALFERALPDGQVEVSVSTAVEGYQAVWRLVIEDLVAQLSPGGVRISINDSGARPDVVALRIGQGLALMGDAQ